MTQGVEGGVRRVKKTALIYDPLFKEHLTGLDHPECPARLDAVLDGVDAAIEATRLVRIAPRDATRPDVLLCHHPEYFDRVQHEIALARDSLSTGDTNVSALSFDAALRAVGAVLTAVDAVMTGEARNAFCAVRPPGHHATANRGMGFCIFNNVAVGARHALLRHGLERVLIIDWDVHHGNGTQAIFDDDPSVFYFSTHQWPLYPGTGARSEVGRGAGRGFTLNCPLPIGSGRHEFMEAFAEELVPAMKHFRPELVMVSAGFDARRDEPISQLTLEDRDFADLTDLVMDLAEDHAGGRLVSVLEGGYGLDGLARAAGAHVGRLTRRI